MTLVVVGHRPGAALLHRQAGLSAVERLDLALVIDREDDGMGGRIDIKADDVAQLAHKLRVGGELELFHPVRLKAVRTPDALDGTRADIDDLRHHGGGPVGRLCWRVSLGEHHDALGDVRPQRRDARWPRLVAQETVITFLHEAFLPAPDTSLRLAGPAHDLIGANTVGTEQDDLGSPDMLGAHRFWRARLRLRSGRVVAPDFRFVRSRPNSRYSKIIAMGQSRHFALRKNSEPLRRRPTVKSVTDLPNGP